MADLSRILSVSRGDQPADCLITNGQIVNVFSGQIERNDIAIVDGIIAGVGPGYAAKQLSDLHGAFVAPGLIDAHVHIESSLCVPSQFARALVPRGVTTVVADPHEIANVTGVAGVHFMASASKGLPLNVMLMAPSCVPATPLATSGATLTAADLRTLCANGITVGLAEMMNFPGVVSCDAGVIEKLHAMQGRPVDGHCPGLSGKALNAYIAAEIGSDHECTTVARGRKKNSPAA